MAHKHLFYRSAAREEVLGAPIVCKDGVITTKAFALRDADENPTRQIAEPSGVDAGVVVDKLARAAER